MTESGSNAYTAQVFATGMQGSALRTPSINYTLMNKIIPLSLHRNAIQPGVVLMLLLQRWTNPFPAICKQGHTEALRRRFDYGNTSLAKTACVSHNFR